MTTPHPTAVPMAIVGLSGRYPGGATSVAALWQNLIDGVDAIVDAPAGRWDRGYLHPDASADRDGRSYVFKGGFLESIDGFDAEFFGLSPREAAQVDPQHRLLLELAWEALEDAAIVPRSLAGSRTGVFVGLSNPDYGQLCATSQANAYTNTGSALSIASNRISYVLDLRGPSMTIDTACSSGLVSVHQACRALAAGDCEMALVGAANMLISPLPWVGFAKASMLSPAGRCKSFDADGQGYVRAEGGGMLLLKPLAAAERDGDAILGVILGTAVNSDGRTLGMSMPSVDAQEAVLRQAYRAAGVAPQDVVYVEAHGTGTSVGDPIECEALGRVLGRARTDGSTLAIGSIKSNIGHLEPASGIAGITKLLLAMRHRRVPANLHFNTPNPRIDFAGWQLKVVAEHLPLPASDAPLLFGINSFGFGGTNAHAVLREYRPALPFASTSVPVATPATTDVRDDAPLLLSAHTAEALAATARRWVAFLRDSDPAPWALIRASAARCRTLHPQRLALRADGPAAAARALEQHLAGEAAPSLAIGRAPAAPRLAFVYSGNGPQWWAMGRELLDHEPRFAAAVEAVDREFRALAGWSLVDELRRDEAGSRMALTEVAQPCLFALQVALTTLLADAGITPDAVIGHSVGEAAAAHASGALDLAQATAVIYHRSTTQARTAGLGRMAALGVSADDAGAAIARVGGFLELAAVNAPRAVTVAGAPESLQALCQMLTDEGRFARLLTLDYPFHTRAMDGIRADLLDRVAGLAPGAGVRPFISSVEGRTIEGHELGADYWWRNVREPVRFADGIAALLQQHATTTFVEIGPHPVLREYVAQCIKERSSSAVTLQTLRRPTPTKAQSDLENLQAAVLACHAHGVARSAQLFPRPARPLPLPGYPWQRTPHWRGQVGLPDVAAASAREHPLLGWRAGHADGCWDNLLDTTLLPWLADHRVQDAAVFPAAGYLEMALAAAASVHGREAVIDVEDLDLLKPMVLTPASAAIVSCQLDTRDGTFDIRTRSGPLASDAVTLHAHGRISVAGSAERPAAANFAALRGAHPVEIGHAAHYRETARRGLHYGPAFQAVRSLRLTEPTAAQRGLLAEIELPEQLAGDLAAYRNHPSLFDAALQTIVSLLAQNESSAAACIPVRVGRLRSFAPLPARFVGQGRLTQDGPRSGLADLVIWDADGQVLLTAHDIRFDKVDFQSRGATPLLTEQWRPDPSGAGSRPLPIALPAPAAVIAALGESLEQIVEAQRRDGPCARAEARIDRAVGAYAADALTALGIEGEPFTLSRLQRRAGVPSAQLPLLQRLIAMAVEDGWLQARGDGWQRASDAPRPDAAEAWRAAWEASPARNAELIQLARVGEALPAILRGATPSPEPLPDTAPFHARCAQRAAAVVEALVRRWPSGRTIRVLEIGGDAGSMLATSLLPLLPPRRSVYTYADADVAAIDRVLQRLGADRMLRGLPLNLDTATPESLAAHSGAHDLIVCTVGLHRSADAAIALTRVRQLLAPGGWLLIVEPRPQRLIELLCGQQDGWWAQGRSPLRSATGWGETLSALGFETPVTVADPAGEAQQSLLLAQKPLDAAAAETNTRPDTPARSRWLLLADASTDGQRFAQAVAAALDRRGQQVRTHTVTSTTTCADLGAALALGAAQIVHLAGLGADGNGDPGALQALRTGTLLRLVQAAKAEPPAGREADPRLQIVTRGAFASPTGGGPLQPAQAPIWGLARVVMNEHAELAPKLIDLHTALDDHGAARLVDELLRVDAETEVMLDDSQRLLCRLEVNDLQALEAIAARGARRAGPWRLAPGAQAGLDQMAIGQVERRAPKAGEVEIAVRAAGLNFRDVLWAMGVLPDEAVEHGFAGAVIGMECAGEVVALGENVQDLQLGDRVIGFASSCFASHVTTAAGAVVRMPTGMGFDAAATIPTAFMTALYALDHLARLEAGERVLIHGAAGGVGLAAVQIAKRRGAIVYGTAGSDDKRRLLRLLGVDAVLNSRSLAFADDVMALTEGRGVDVVLNSLAGEAITKNLQILAPYGRLLEIGKRDLYANSRIGLRPFRNNLSYFGVDVDTLQIERPALARRLLLELMQRFDAGELQPLPHQAMPVTRAAHAFRLMQQSRHVGKLVLTMPPSGVAPAPAEAPPLRRDGSYLVTGGLGGFGLATARWLVEQGAGALALMSRRGATTDEARDGIEAMRAAGATVVAYAADVTNSDDVARVLADIRATLPPLRGVVHAAMVLDDAPLLQLDAERLERVLAPKIRGAWQLHRQTAADPLDLFVMYSSATTTIGNPGQGNYVAANLFLESLAERRRAEGRPALAVGWGAIQDVGVVTRHAGLEKLIASRSGMQAVPAAQALAELGRLLAVEATRVAPTRFDSQRLAATGLAGVRAPRCAVLAPRNLREAGGTARETLAERLARMPAASHHAAIADAVHAHLGRILGTGAAQINPQQALSDMGLDSLMAVELASALERDTGRPVSVMRMIQAGSSQAIVELLADAMRKTPQAA